MVLPPAPQLTAASAEDDANVTCSVAPGMDPTAELGERLQRAAVAVLELKLVMPTLEEYFYSITDGLDHLEEEAAVEAATVEDAAEPGEGQQ